MSWTGFEKERLGEFVPDVIEIWPHHHNRHHTVITQKDETERGGAPMRAVQ